ncbi:MAG: helix-hairpin-helix domain-containing protein [Bacilli bacterium]
MVKWIIGGLVGLIVMIVVFTQIDPNLKTNTVSGDQIVEIEEGNTINIKIEGQVLHPGTYAMKTTDTIYDLVTKAGGLLASADTDAINLDVTLEGRELVYIPKIAGYSESCVLDSSVAKVNINTATAEELSTISGISLNLGNAIVAYREENGPFQTLEDIQNVSGIGEKTYEKIRDYITLK